MATAAEIVEIIDELTLEMIDSVKMGEISKLKALSELRGAKIELLSKTEGSVPEASMSKLLNDAKLFDRIFEEQMRKTSEKIEKISENMRSIQNYSARSGNSQINERR